MIFAHKPDANLAQLTQQLDKIVADNTEKEVGYIRQFDRHRC